MWWPLRNPPQKLLKEWDSSDDTWPRVYLVNWDNQKNYARSALVFYRSPVAVSVQLIPQMEADLDSVITDLLAIHGHRELFLNAHDSGLRKLDWRWGERNKTMECLTRWLVMVNRVFKFTTDRRREWKNKDGSRMSCTVYDFADIFKQHPTEAAKWMHPELSSGPVL